MKTTYKTKAREVPVVIITGYLGSGKTTLMQNILKQENFLFKGAEGDFVLEPDEYLPYDVTKDEIFLDDTGFVTMCIDSLERPEVYAGKKAHFMARVYKMREGGELEFIAGRRVMTCCEADLSFMGIICGYPKAYELMDREWVEITGVLRVRYDEMTKADIVVCRVTELQNAEAPQEEILTLT